MAENNTTLPLTMDSIAALIKEVGYDQFVRDDAGERIMLDVKGNETLMRVQIGIGKTPDAHPWFVRLLSYSLEFEPIRMGVEVSAMLEWLNTKNTDLLFGRYYFQAESDTVAFEVAFPCNLGIAREDFLDMLQMATLSVDRTHEGLKKLPA